MAQFAPPDALDDGGLRRLSPQALNLNMDDG
jgi:hypothetical protein